MRAAFFRHVGLTALNLVLQTKLCHYDIWPPNIAVLDSSFCLIDFDLAASELSLVEDPTAFIPQISQAWNWLPLQELQCFSVAQLAVCVFMLNYPHKLENVTSTKSLWMNVRDPKSQVDRDFETWVKSCGEPLVGFVSTIRRACCEVPDSKVALVPKDVTPYLVRVLRCMLSLPQQLA